MSTGPRERETENVILVKRRVISKQKQHNRSRKKQNGGKLKLKVAFFVFNSVLVDLKLVEMIQTQ